MENQLPPKRKLNIVGLHGYNTNKEVFEFQSRQFKERFGDVMDFHVFEGPHLAKDEPIQALVDRGFKPPFKSYLGLGEQLELDETKVQERVASFRITSIDVTINKFAEFSREHGPFDGALCFSQGSIFFRHMYRVVNDIDKETWAPIFSEEKVNMPSFIINIGGPFFPKSEILYKDVSYT
jgi:hypothetical protein